MSNRFSNLELNHDAGRTVGAERTGPATVGTTSHFREPDHDDAYWLAAALVERRAGRHEAALRYYSRALESNRAIVAGWVGQVRMLIALGEYPEADLWARKALELFRNNPELLAARGQALCRRSDFTAAAASCDAALAQPGLSAGPWLARGELMLAKRHATADYCFDKAIHFDGDWLNRLEIGDIHLHYGRPANAAAHFRHAASGAPDQAYCWYKQGQCELALGLTGAAAKSFEQCLQLVPNHADARRELHAMAQNRRPVRSWLRRMVRRR